MTHNILFFQYVIVNAALITHNDECKKENLKKDYMEKEIDKYMQLNPDNSNGRAPG